MASAASVQLQMMGRHNVPNALAAIAVGLRSGMSLEECAAALGEMRAGDKRGEVLEWRGATLINDCYNSNPRALNAMVDALMAMPAERQIVVAGEMLELGPECCGAACVLVGGEWRSVELLVVGVRGWLRPWWRRRGWRGGGGVCRSGEAGEWLVANVRAGDAVLLKASRGVRLERALAVVRPDELAEVASTGKGRTRMTSVGAVLRGGVAGAGRCS